MAEEGALERDWASVPERRKWAAAAAAAAWSWLMAVEEEAEEAVGRCASQGEARG